jgi:hypothetical protein
LIRPKQHGHRRVTGQFFSSFSSHHPALEHGRKLLLDQSQQPALKTPLQAVQSPCTIWPFEKVVIFSSFINNPSFSNKHLAPVAAGVNDFRDSSQLLIPETHSKSALPKGHKNREEGQSASRFHVPRVMLTWNGSGINSWLLSLKSLTPAATSGSLPFSTSASRHSLSS